MTMLTSPSRLAFATSSRFAENNWPKTAVCLVEPNTELQSSRRLRPHFHYDHFTASETCHPVYVLMGMLASWYSSSEQVTKPNAFVHHPSNLGFTGHLSGWNVDAQFNHHTIAPQFSPAQANVTCNISPLGDTDLVETSANQIPGGDPC